MITALAIIALLAGAILLAICLAKAATPSIGDDWRICDGCGQWTNEFRTVAKNPPDTWDGVVRGSRICADCESAGSLNKFLAESGQPTKENQ